MKRQVWIIVIAAAVLLAGPNLVIRAMVGDMPGPERLAGIRSEVQSIWVRTSDETEAWVAPALTGLVRHARGVSRWSMGAGIDPRIWQAGGLALALALLLAARMATVSRRGVANPVRQVRRLAARGTDIAAIARRMHMPQDAVRDLVHGGGRTVSGRA